ncbi:DEAD/DEAH box helicase [Vagococcus intermedius]|uniref:DEAD/DEAH box helicase n=1 Tax=Vagococcus intermedius TaxID=2991418 RepID=A0AAF0I741_9ENTE|nr:DEAD/DEAH box helicase [Vagococcus intermedius]WEG73080.1 DEAD/DEAH box helicase [Vagococcus intermedius]WEG75164.1 DEAD/DEAH box helicase [Vagococcus intermedius]
MRKSVKSSVLEQALQRGFINKEMEGSEYAPKLVINNPKTKTFVINDILKELSGAKSFFFSIAFVTQSGLNELKTMLADLNLKGIKGRLLTSNYLAFNSPDVYKSLLEIPNLDVRLSSKPGFHAKGYLFEKDDYYSLILGSSNLTKNAVKVNYEWNILLNSLENGELIQQTINFMEAEWSESSVLTPGWIEEYRKVYQAQFSKTLKQQNLLMNPSEDSLNVCSINNIKPNKMQQVALENLNELRETGEKRGLVISATGTGKTYLSAFDVRQYQPKRMLFIVHREQILNKARQEFQKILGGNSDDFGILSGTQKETSAKYLFSTIQTISKDNYLEQFGPDYFDYILIDEVHKAGADSYQKVIDYFKPEFLLGMTATPERTDGFDIFGLFDNNIAYEIRLQEALEENMLTPFHYFGVTDYIKNGETIEETSDLQFLVADERVDFLVEKLRYYGCDGDKVKGLVFCSQKNEVKELAKKFSERGLESDYLTGDHSLETREKVVQELESGELSYVFTVDIFNEGIDIPEINQVVMLRNTQSNIIFVQQLGRGLRKHESKEFVTVIDFIGNYKNNYMIPMALTGDSSRNKNSLRRDTFEANYISGLSSVNFETIAKERIYYAIDQASLDSMAELRKAFELLKNRLGRVPYLCDFEESNMLEPLIIANKYGNYHHFLVKVKESTHQLTTDADRYLKIASREFLPGHRRHEQIVLRCLLRCGEMKLEQLMKVFETNNLLVSNKTVRSVINVLNLTFFSGSNAKTYAGAPFIKENEGTIFLTETFLNCLEDDYFKKLFLDILVTSDIKNEKYNQSLPLTLHDKYTRKEVLKLLEWEEEMVPLNIGGYTYKEGQFVIFVTLQKGSGFNGAKVAYRDELLSSSEMKLYSKTGRSLKSNEVKILLEPHDWQIHLFIQKSNDEGKDFYYMGEVLPIRESIQEVKERLEDGTIKDLVEYDVQLKQSVDNALYQYLLSGDDAKNAY